MPGRKELRSIRLRREATSGTRETPRYLWRGNGDMLKDSREVTPVEEQVGIFGGTDRTYIAKMLGELSMASTPATYEQLSDLFLAAGCTEASGNPQGSRYGAGPTMVFSLIIPGTSAPTVSSYTIEAGESDTDSEAEVMPWSIVTELTLEGAGNEALMVSANWQGQYVDRTNDSGSFSAAGTLPSVETILAGRGTVSFAMPGTNISTANRVTAGNVLGVSISFKPKWAWKYPVDHGTIYPYQAVFTGMDIEGELTWEHQTGGSLTAAGTNGQKQDWRDEQPQLMQLAWRGGSISMGTVYTNKLLQITLPIKYISFDPLGDQDGNSTIVSKFISKYNADISNASIAGSTNVGQGRGRIVISRSGTSEFSGA